MSGSNGCICCSKETTYWCPSDGVYRCTNCGVGVCNKCKPHIIGARWLSVHYQLRAQACAEESEPLTP